MVVPLVAFIGETTNFSQVFIKHSKTQETSYKATDECKTKMLKSSKPEKIHETHGLRNQGDMTDNHNRAWGLGLSKTKKTASKI